MKEYANRQEMSAALEGVLEGGKVLDPVRLRGDVIDALTGTAVFAREELRDEARRAIHDAARSLGCAPASIQGLYDARGRRECGNFTVPAVNVRGLTYDVSRALFRTARALDCGAFIFEIARSEIGYTGQRPGEYATVVLAAAIKEGHAGPVFIQGDHFQANPQKYAADPEGEIEAIRKLTREAIEAGFYNIDIDMSTLVDLSHPTVREQQRVNFTRGAELTALIRRLEPKGVTVSVGGEIGEVGKKNSTVEEFRAYIDGLNEELARIGPGMKGISKISVQTGTTHGGVPLPDGRVADVAIDFDVLRSISQVAIDDYRIAGCVQHGASTLPEEAFDRFPATGTAEIHLATGFQNLIYEHLPAELKGDIYAYLDKKSGDERKDSETSEQFYYKTRKKAFGPFKRDLWSLAEEARGPLLAALEERFKLLMTRLNVPGTRAVVQKYTG